MRYYFEDGLPYLDGLTIVVDINNVTSRVNAMDTGAVHCVDELPASALPSFTSSDVRILRSKNSSWTPIVMQQNLTPFQATASEWR